MVTPVAVVSKDLQVRVVAQFLVACLRRRNDGEVTRQEAVHFRISVGDRLQYPGGRVDEAHQCVREVLVGDHRNLLAGAEFAKDKGPSGDRRRLVVFVISHQARNLHQWLPARHVRAMTPVKAPV